MVNRSWWLDGVKIACNAKLLVLRDAKVECMDRAVERVYEVWPSIILLQNIALGSLAGGESWMVCFNSPFSDKESQSQK